MAIETNTEVIRTDKTVIFRAIIMGVEVVEGTASTVEGEVVAAAAGW